MNIVQYKKGDIVKVVDESGASVAEYTYDAWGNILTETGNFYVRTYNPFRYRGYYYDVETELYYLQSRYYDPAVGRFLNADAVDYLGATGTVLGYNLYAYCENNNVNLYDPTGNVVFGIGITCQYMCLTGGFVSVTYLWDNKGNHGIFISTGVGVGLFGVSLAVSATFSWRSTVYDYIGTYGWSIGGSLTIGPGAGVFIGGDISFDKKGPSAFTISLGIGVGITKIEAHCYGCIGVYIPLQSYKFKYYKKYNRAEVGHYLRKNTNLSLRKLQW